MKHTGIHILDFNDKIIDYISRDDGALLNAVMSTNAEEKSETFDFTMLNDRAEHLRERNRIIAQDNNGVYREFIISHVVDNFDGTTDVESNASYLEDIDKSRPIKPGKYSSYSTSQALNETLRNTGWEMSDDTEHGGMRTTSWTSYSTPYEVINMLCTTYGMVAEYYIELGSHTVEHRYVTLKKPVSLFKGKEITKGKDLTGMTRTVDMSEVRTALYAIGPENDTGQRLEKIVTDDDAQAQFGLPGRYLWSVYEPESDDSNMTDERLTTLAKTELNKRNKSAISYEITSTDIHKHYPEMVVSLHDTVRIKDRDFRPPLYIEAEVIGVDYNLLTDESNYKFGNVVEYEENNLRDIFNKKLADISKKLNDNVTNINTIVNDVVSGQLEYYERKIFKQDTPPDNPVNDMLWYDTSNPNVAVLRRYWNGEWLNETVDDVEKIGGITREKALLSELQNTFANLSIQHSKILNDTNEVLNSEYLVDTDLKNQLQTEINNIDEIYLSIQNDLNAMTPDTATIGALIDIQSQFSSYRQKLQDLYKAMRDAQVSADKRLQLLQSQYTDEKFNDALNKVATKFGLTIDENNNMVGTPDVIEKAVQASREDTEEQLKSYVKSIDYQTDKNGIVQRLDSADSERLQLSNQISDKVSLSEYRNLKVGGRNYLANDNVEFGTFFSSTGDPAGTPTTRVRNINFIPITALDNYIMKINKPIANKTLQVSIYQYDANNALIKSSGFSTLSDTLNYNFDTGVEKIKMLFRYSDNTDMTLDDIRNAKIKFEKGTIPTDYDIASEETDTKLTNMNTSISQNGKDIQQRATKEELNSSKKTLSKVISDFTNNVATGMTFTYDENGAIQLMNIGSDGIKLKGDKVDITVNKDFNVVTQNLNNKVGKDEVINRINLSNEGLDINVNKLGIVGGDSTNSLTIRNNQILSRGKYSRTWSGVTDTPNATVGIRNGYIMSSNEDTGYNLYMTEKGLSTMMSGGLGSEQAGALEFHYDLMNDKSRGVRLSSTYGVVFLQAEQSRIYTRSRFTTNIETWEGSIYLRPWAGGRVGANEFSFYIKQNDTAQFTDGVLLFGEISNETNIPGYGNAGSGIRFRKAGMPTETYGDYEPIVYATNNQGDIGSGSFYANRLYGDWTTKTDNLYACVNDKLRITDIKGYNSGNTNYKNLQCKDIQANTIRVNTGNNFYLGVSTGELRVTNNLMYNGGDIGYKPVVASDFVKASRAEYKKDISLWKTDALRTIAEDLDLYSYKYKEDEQEIIHHGPVIGDDYKTPNVFVTGDGINTNELLTYALKAIQQLNEKVEKLEEQINGK
ncbi:putative minor structural protein [uncultured Caudovirales phage]|uniref:Putative minor structural protein n=1 Tax=uncultured Caudovirales phage TaxID=2100421 RepID=A0A2H4J300_9CAUD|nr:putative minor structural protein [uncultured Caudovirales phage]